METTYRIIIPKERVQGIISGEQRVLTLDWAEPYISLFIDKEQMAENERLIAEGRQDECRTVLRGDVWQLEFTDEAGSYSLQVVFDDYGVLRLDQQDIAYLATEYNYHALDEEWLLYRRLPYQEKPMFFYFHIEKLGNN